MATQNFSCPQCGSENIQRFSVAFRGGASTIDTKTAGTGVGLSGGHLGIGVGGAHTTGVQMTQLAKEVAPPVKKKYLFPIIASIIVSFLLSVFTESIIGATVSGFLGFIGFAACLYFLAYQKTYLWNKNVWPELYNQWEHSWVCLKCGHKFIM